MYTEFWTLFPSFQLSHQSNVTHSPLLLPTTLSPLFLTVCKMMSCTSVLATVLVPINPDWYYSLVQLGLLKSIFELTSPEHPLYRSNWDIKYLFCVPFLSLCESQESKEDFNLVFLIPYFQPEQYFLPFMTKKFPFSFFLEGFDDCRMHRMQSFVLL